MPASPEPLQFDVDPETRVSALWQRPDRAGACYVMAHGAVLIAYVDVEALVRHERLRSRNAAGGIKTGQDFYALAP